MDRIVAGMEGTPMVDGKSKSLVAYHEVRLGEVHPAFTMYHHAYCHTKFPV